MAFTVTSPFYDEDERRRKAAAELAAAGNAGAKGILSGLEYADRDKKYQAELRFKQAGDDRDAKRLVLQANADARAAEGDKRDAESHVATLRFKQSEEARKADEAARAQGSDYIKGRVTEALAAGQSADDLSRVLVDEDAAAAVGPADVLSEYERQSKARMDESIAANDKSAKDALAEREMVRKEKDSAAQRARDYAAAKAAAQKQNAPEKVDPKALEAKQQAVKNLERIDRILANKGEFNTGPLVTPTARAIGTMAPEWLYDGSDRAVWESDVQEVLNSIISEQSGANVTTQEMARQLIAQLNAGMDDNAFVKQAEKVRNSYARDLADANARLTPSSRAAAADPAARLEQIPAKDLDSLSLEERERMLAEMGG